MQEKPSANEAVTVPVPASKSEAIAPSAASDAHAIALETLKVLRSLDAHVSTLGYQMGRFGGRIAHVEDDIARLKAEADVRGGVHAAMPPPGDEIGGTLERLEVPRPHQKSLTNDVRESVRAVALETKAQTPLLKDAVAETKKQTPMLEAIIDGAADAKRVNQRYPWISGVAIFLAMFVASLYQDCAELHPGYRRIPPGYAAPAAPPSIPPAR